MGKIQTKCNHCGNTFHKYPSEMRERKFSSNHCRLAWFSEWTTEAMNVPGHSAGHKAPHLTALNQARRNRNKPPRPRNERGNDALFSARTTIINYTDNPKWYAETREKVSRAFRDHGECKTYRKYHGRHEHRVIAEMILGRPLRNGEAVHHIDGSKRNNIADNLMVFGSSAEHARTHFSKKKGR